VRVDRVMVIEVSEALGITPVDGAAVGVDQFAQRELVDHLLQNRV
jgi:hypothetical protein